MYIRWVTRRSYVWLSFLAHVPWIRISHIWIQLFQNVLAAVTYRAQRQSLRCIFRFVCNELTMKFVHCIIDHHAHVFTNAGTTQAQCSRTGETSSKLLSNHAASNAPVRTAVCEREEIHQVLLIWGHCSVSHNNAGPLLFYDRFGCPPSVCHTCDSRINGPIRRNILYTTRQTHVSNFSDKSLQCRVQGSPRTTKLDKGISANSDNLTNTPQ